MSATYRRIAKYVSGIAALGAATFGSYSAAMWFLEAISDGLTYIEAGEIAGGFFVIAFAVYLFGVAQNPSGDTLSESMLGDRNER